MLKQEFLKKLITLSEYDGNWIGLFEKKNLKATPEISTLISSRERRKSNQNPIDKSF